MHGSPCSLPFEQRSRHSNLDGRAPVIGEVLKETLRDLREHRILDPDFSNRFLIRK